MRYRNVLSSAALMVSIVSAIPMSWDTADAGKYPHRTGGPVLFERFRKSHKLPSGEWPRTQEAADACLEYLMWRDMTLTGLRVMVDSKSHQPSTGFKNAIVRCKALHGFQPQVSDWLGQELQKAADAWAEGWDPMQEKFSRRAMMKEGKADLEAYTKNQDRRIELQFGKKPSRASRTSSAPAPPLSGDSKNDAVKNPNNNHFSLFSRISLALNEAANEDRNRNKGLAIPWNEGAMPKFQQFQIPRPSL